LGLYESLIPGSAERLLAAFESQQRHRQSLETRIVESGVQRSWYGLWCALAVALSGMAIAALAVVYGQPTPASIIGGGTLGALVTAFLTGRSHQERERAERRNALMGRPAK
jgi:uncharacterized membrane protein